LFNNKLFTDKTENLKFSTSDKQRLFKRREIVKSMKFLRRMGEKLRDEQIQIMQELIKQDKKVKKKQTKIMKSLTVENHMSTLGILKS
jgi:site-specific recombinase